MDLRRLRYLVETIEQGSISKAAKRLALSQPALTKSLRLLEEELDVPLLDRTSTGVVATMYGRSLYEHAKAVEAEMAHARAELGLLRGKHGGAVHIAALPSMAGILARAVALVAQQHPLFAARIVEKMNFELLPTLRRGDFDFVVGLVEDEPLELGVRRLVILRDELAVVVRPAHPLAQRRAVAAADLAPYPWLFSMVGSSQRHVLEQFFLAAGVATPAARIDCTSVQFIKSLVGQSDYVGVLPRHVMEQELAATGLHCLPVESDLLQRQIGIYYRDHHPLSAAARVMMRAVEMACAELAGRLRDELI